MELAAHSRNQMIPQEEAHQDEYDEIDSVEECIDRLFRDVANKLYSFRYIKSVSRETTARLGLDLASVRNPRKHNCTLLHEAAGYGRTQWVRDLIVHEDADVNLQDDKGRTPLHAACNHAHKTVAKQLIEKGANVNARDYDGWTPLHFALVRRENSVKVQPHYWEVVELLLDFKADPYLLTKKNPINCFALIKDSEQRRCVRINHLLNKMQSCDDKEPQSRESVINKYLRVKDFFELVKIGDDTLDTIQKLLTNRLLTSRLETYDDITPLHRAAGHNHINVAKLFIEAGADLNITDAHGRIPLHNAAQWGHIEMIELLVNRGSDINWQDLEGFTPIHIAATNTTFTACLKLVELGASTTVRTKTGKLPYDLAQSDDVREVLRCDDLQGARMIASTSEHAIYIGFQDEGCSDSICKQQQEYESTQTSLMLDSSSSQRLFDSKHQIKKVILDTDDPRYQLVKKQMFDTIVCHATDIGGRFSGYEIINIEYILHEKVWSKYKLMCQRLEIDYGHGSKNEKLLFHGSNFIDRIQSVGFDERYAHRNGMFGAGIYFAAHSSKSNQYTFGFGQGCLAHNNKSCYICERKLIYAQVALGRSLKSKEAMPECAHAPPGYSSVTGLPETTDNLIYPEYVIYSGDQAYPLFVITYRIKP